jgi:hypothetical protein
LGNHHFGSKKFFYFPLLTNFCVRDAEFLLTPFYSPSLNELERGNNSKKLFVSPLSFSKERGRGVSCVRDAEGGGERSEPSALP